jgi:predicted molibdopterin-dependent oxidoreductase YjgC
MPPPVRILVDGKPVTAAAGASVAAALMNAGVAAVRTSPLGEPRGPWCGMGVCFECRATVDGRPEVRTCLTVVRDGMEVRTRGV